MIAATDEEMRKALCACEELRCEGRNLAFAEPSAISIKLDLRIGGEPTKLAYLARLLGALGYYETDFEGAYLWLTRWGVFDSREEAIGLKTLEQFRRSYGENRPLEAAPGHFFRNDEFVESVCCLLQPMIIGWDAYYVPHWSYGYIDYFVEVSHDSFIDIHVRTKEMAQKIVEILESNNWIKPLLRK
jgi:hypothetical protein